MILSQQSFPYTTSKYLNKIFENEGIENDIQKTNFDKNDIDGNVPVFY